MQYYLFRFIINRHIQTYIYKLARTNARTHFFHVSHSILVDLEKIKKKNQTNLSQYLFQNVLNFTHVFTYFLYLVAVLKYFTVKFKEAKDSLKKAHTQIYLLKMKNNKSNSCTFRLSTKRQTKLIRLQNIANIE